MLLLKSCFLGRKKIDHCIWKSLYSVMTVYHTNLRLASEPSEGMG